MDALQILRLPALQDNYIWLLRVTGSGFTAVVDPAEVGPVEQALDARGWALHAILNTHHHGDHVGANLALKARHGLTIYGPAADRARIPGIDVALGDGDEVDLGGLRARVMDVPGHTRGHILWHLPEAGAVFVGDTLFAGGCGRMFEGTAPQFWASLARIRALPPISQIYCAHEYTLGNLRFACSIDPHNLALQARLSQVEAARQRGEPTVPSTLAIEQATNPFLRCDQPAIAGFFGLDPAEPAAVFGALRAAKDRA